jgi:hypothetical protein
MAPTALDYARLSGNASAVTHTKAEHKHYLSELERLFSKTSLSGSAEVFT